MDLLSIRAFCLKTLKSWRETYRKALTINGFLERNNSDKNMYHTRMKAEFESYVLTRTQESRPIVLHEICNTKTSMRSNDSTHDLTSGRLRFRPSRWCLMSLFSQRKYVVICFKLRPSQPKNMTKIYFLAVEAIFWKYWFFGHIRSQEREFGQSPWSESEKRA